MSDMSSNEEHSRSPTPFFNDEDMAPSHVTKIRAGNTNHKTHMRGKLDISKASRKRKDKQRQSKPHGRDVDPRAQCLQAARWIPHGFDMFYDLGEVIRVCLLLEEDAIIAAGSEEDTEEAKHRREKILSKINEITRSRYLRIFDYLKEHAPYLIGLIEKNKQSKLQTLISEMQRMMSRVCSDDASHLRSHVGAYTAPEPDRRHINPPIDPKASKARLGFHHPELARLLCPVRFLQEFDLDPTETRKKLLDGRLPSGANLNPTFLYEGKPAGENYDRNEVHKGFFKGYFIERVLKHTFTSPSSALSEKSRNTRPGNGKIHRMTSVSAPHLLYCAVQARFSICSLDKFKEMDGLFGFTNFYYRHLNFLEENEGEDWVQSIYEHHNLILFKNEARLTHHADDPVDNDDNDDLAVIKRQIAARLAAASGSRSSGNGCSDFPQDQSCFSPPVPRSPAPADHVTQSLSAPFTQLTPKRMHNTNDEMGSYSPLTSPEDEGNGMEDEDEQLAKRRRKTKGKQKAVPQKRGGRGRK